jgi:hypothetical protein
VRTRLVRVSSGLEQSALALMFSRYDLQHHVTSRLAKANSDIARKAGRWCGCLASGGGGILLRLCILTCAAKVPTGPDGLHEIKHDGNSLIVQREGSHATRSASATASAATSLFRRFEISV